jgi:hypothetical protein
MQALQKYLNINSLFSAFSGIVMLVFSNALHRLFNIENPYVFPFIGVNLLFFAVFVFFVAKKHLANKLLINIIATLDALWVLGSLAILLLQAFNLSSTGYLLIALVALWIAFLGYQQFKYNRV